MLKYRKKEIVIIVLIFTFAVTMTHHIYYKFINLRTVDYKSETIDVTFHEKVGNEVNITKVTPVTDSVGLSSSAHTFTIKNNTNRNLKYRISLYDNKDKYKNDECGEYKIPKNLIKFSIHKNNEKNVIYTLNNLIDGQVIVREIKANEEQEYIMRFWITTNDIIPSSSFLHYHGLIKVENIE